tara:strand:+ start:79 stop:789 length:711 start_codon:yes stop_codon:yes gene_type:complete
MGSGGGTSGGSDNVGPARGRPRTTTPQQQRAINVTTDPIRMRTGTAPLPSTPRPRVSEKAREVGVRYDSGGNATIMRTAPSGELARRSGISPSEVLATIGSSGYGQDAAAKLAGRTDVDRRQLGNLAMRANVGQLPFGALKIIGKRRAKTILDTLIEGGQRGFIQGVDDVTPRVTSEVTSEIVPDDVSAATAKTQTLIEGVLRRKEMQRRRKEMQRKDRNLLGRGEDMPMEARILK